jgi:hypothetical protein
MYMKTIRALTFSMLLITTNVCPAQPSKLDTGIGAQTFEMIRKTKGLYSNPQLLNVVKEVGLALEKELNLGYELKYLPGGHFRA